ncbi:MAG: DHA2 family efflux MFS transporter permease subunit, partial [Chloroflexota bacterium]
MSIKRFDYKWTALFVVAVGTLAITLDEGAVRIVLPELGADFSARPDDVVWVWLIYMLMGAGLVLTFGRLGDALGRRRIYLAGMALFTVGLTLSSVATSLTQLVGVRALQATGMAMAVAMSNAIVTASFPAEERGRALGIMGTVVSIGLLAGPATGGALLDWMGWRAVFYARIPFGLLAVALALLLKSEPPERKHRAFDLAGSGTLFAGLASVLVAINRGQSSGWTSPFVIGAIVLGMLLLVAFVRIERRASDPVLDLSLFKTRSFSSTNAAHTLFYVSALSLRFVLPYLVLQALGISATISGLVVASIEAVRALVSPLSGQLSDKIGTWVLATIGTAMVALGTLLMLLTVSADTGIHYLVLLLSVVGLGAGFFVAPNTSRIMGSVPRPQLGTASAM